MLTLTLLRAFVHLQDLFSHIDGQTYYSTLYMQAYTVSHCDKRYILFYLSIVSFVCITWMFYLSCRLSHLNLNLRERERVRDKDKERESIKQWWEWYSFIILLLLMSKGCEFKARLFTQRHCSSQSIQYDVNSPENVQERAPLKHLVCYIDNISNTSDPAYREHSPRRCRTGWGYTWIEFELSVLRWFFIKLYKITLKGDQTFNTRQRSKTLQNVFQANTILKGKKEPTLTNKYLYFTPEIRVNLLDLNSWKV